VFTPYSTIPLTKFSAYFSSEFVKSSNYSAFSTITVPLVSPLSKTKGHLKQAATTFFTSSFAYDSGALLIINPLMSSLYNASLPNILHTLNLKAEKDTGSF